MVNTSELPLPLPWGEIPQYPHVDCAPKMTHRRLIRWYTSGFRLCAHFWGIYEMSKPRPTPGPGLLFAGVAQTEEYRTSIPRVAGSRPVTCSTPAWETGGPLFQMTAGKDRQSGTAGCGHPPGQKGRKRRFDSDLFRNTARWRAIHQCRSGYLLE